MATYEDSRRHLNQTTIFEGSDILDCRGRAINYYKTIKVHVGNANEYLGMPFKPYKTSVRGKTAIISIDLVFEADGDYITLIGGEGKEHDLDHLRCEYSVLLSMGYTPYEIPVLSGNGVTAEEVKKAYEEVLSEAA